MVGLRSYEFKYVPFFFVFRFLSPICPPGGIKFRVFLDYGVKVVTFWDAVFKPLVHFTGTLKAKKQTSKLAFCNNVLKDSKI